MSIVFNAKDHSYKSNDDLEINWISVTTLVSHFKKPFDAETIAKKVIKNKKSKWYGLSSISNNGFKVSNNQKLDPGIYPEHMVYLKSAGICGQSDLVEVVNGRVNIIDYKTNKEIKKESYIDWEGISEKLSQPLSALDDCNFNHYALQLSIYMYIILKHNPKLQPGKINIHHILFEVEETDQWGYPIARLNDDGDPIVKEVIPIDIPYLKDEVISIIHYLQDNRNKIKKK